MEEEGLLASGAWENDAKLGGFAVRELPHRQLAALEAEEPIRTFKLTTPRHALFLCQNHERTRSPR